MKISDEIDLLGLIKKIISNKLTVVLCLIIGLITGIIYSLSLKNIYESKTIFIPQTNKNLRSNGISTFARAAGINIPNENQTEISPNLYPLLLDNVLVKTELLKIEYDSLDLKKIIDNHYSKINYNPLSIIKSFPSKVFKFFNKKSINKTYNDSLIYITNEEQYYYDILNDIINISINENEGFIEIKSMFPDPRISAVIAENAKDLLQKKIIEYKIQNASETVKFLQKNYNLKKNELNEIEFKLANFKDKNQTISSSKYNIELISLESEYSLIKTVYTQLATQLEDAKLDLNKTTPLFTIIDPVIIPNSKTYPNRTLIVIIFSLISLVISISYILLKDEIIHFKEKIIK